MSRSRAVRTILALGLLYALVETAEVHSRMETLRLAGGLGLYTALLTLPVGCFVAVWALFSDILMTYSDQLQYKWQTFALPYMMALLAALFVFIFLSAVPLDIWLHQSRRAINWEAYTGLNWALAALGVYVLNRGFLRVEMIALRLHKKQALEPYKRN